MKFFQNNWFSLGEFLIGLINPSTDFTAYISSLARNSVFREDIVYAGKYGKKVKIIITDYKNNHTSYSTQVTYEIIN